MRESGLFGFFRIVFNTVHDGYNVRRAWLVISILVLVLVLPFALIAGVILLLI